MGDGDRDEGCDDDGSQDVAGDVEELGEAGVGGGDGEDVVDDGEGELADVSVWSLDSG